MHYDPSVYRRFMRHVLICSHGTICEQCCWPWQGSRYPNQYGRFFLPSSHTNQCSTHVFMCEWAWGPLNGLFACHSCDNPPCVQPNHLWPGTNQHNIQDAARKQRLNSPIGERHGSAQLTANDIPMIFTMRRNGMTYAAIAAHFHVSYYTVKDVLRRHTWKHICILTPGG